MKNVKLILLICFILTFFSVVVFAMNPFITQIYTADPSAHVFENRVYVYPSHDKDNAGFFDMEDYHVFSSADLINWVDHGVVFSYKDADWIMQPDGTSGYPTTAQHPRLWAPDCAFKNNTYYFYYPAHDKNVPSVKTNGKWPQKQFKIGVASSKSPCGPFIPVTYNKVETYIPNSYSVDPCVFVDDDGKAYMAFGGQSYGGMQPGEGPLIVKLKSNMIEFEGTPGLITNNGTSLSDWFEACWIHKRNGIYYLSYATPMGNGSSEIHYAMNTNIANNNGWIPQGTTLFPAMSGSTNHGSIVEYKGKWYAFYHNSDMSGGIREKRGICVDQLIYNSNGTIRKLRPTRDGVGTSAYSRIKAQFLNFYDKPDDGALLDNANYTQDCGGGDIGKCVCNIKQGFSIVGYYLDFGSIGSKSVDIQVASNSNGGKIVVGIAEGNKSGLYMTEELGEVEVNNTGDWHNWTTVTCNLDQTLYGEKNIMITCLDKNNNANNYLFNVNWFRFKPAVNIPIGYSVAFKSLNPYCYDDKNGVGPGQMYLSTHTVSGWGNYVWICADRYAVGGAWEKFSILTTTNRKIILDKIQLNSSNNGKNLKLVNYFSSPPIDILAEGGDAFSLPTQEESIRWKSNSDGTITLHNKYYSKYFRVDTNYYPAALVVDSTSIGPIDERFYAEVVDAPIGCKVAFKSLNSNCADKPYLSIDPDNNYELCVGKTKANGNSKKFLVVDAGNGYIALKSLYTNQYLHFDLGGGYSFPGKADFSEDQLTALNSAKFQWQNNGDGTISLISVGYQKYVCADSNKGTNPVKIYLDEDGIKGSWEKFYCQIVK